MSRFVSEIVLALTLLALQLLDLPSDFSHRTLEPQRCCSSLPHGHGQLIGTLSSMCIETRRGMSLYDCHSQQCLQFDLGLELQASQRCLPVCSSSPMPFSQQRLNLGRRALPYPSFCPSCRPFLASFLNQTIRVNLEIEEPIIALILKRHVCCLRVM